MRLKVRSEQIEVMDAVVEANFRKRIGDHVRQGYPDAVVKLPEGGDLTVSTVSPGLFDDLVETAISKARKYLLTQESSIAAFVALMFDVAPNFDTHRLCEVLLNDEEKRPDDRVSEIPKVLTEKNWLAIREGYDPNAWTKPAPAGGHIPAGPTDETMRNVKPEAIEPIDKTVSNKTMTRTIRRRSAGVEHQPGVPETQPEFDEKTIMIERKIR